MTVGPIPLYNPVILSFLATTLKASIIPTKQLKYTNEVNSDLLFL